MDITSIETYNNTEYKRWEFTLLKGDVKVAFFGAYKMPKMVSEGYYLFNAWDGDLSISKKDNMIVFNHDEAERGNIVLYVNDSYGKFWSIVQSTCENMKKNDF